MSDCIEAIGKLDSVGYHIGTIQVGPGKWYRVGQHRMAYFLAYGSIPAGMIVRHKCDNGGCVNPDHLELGTPKDNSRDMSERGRARNQNTGKTHCSQGHPLTPGNLVPSVAARGRRDCLICSRVRARKWYEQKRTVSA